MMDVKCFLPSPGSGVQNAGCVPAGATYRMLHVAAGYVGCFHFSYGFNCFHLYILYYFYGNMFIFGGGVMEIDDLLCAKVDPLWENLTGKEHLMWYTQKFHSASQ